VNLDVDGVLADLLGVALPVHHRLFGSQATVDDVTDWSMTSIVPKEHARAFWREVAEERPHTKMKPYPGAVEGVRALVGVATVYIVTSPLGACRTWARDREDWLLDNFGIGSDYVIHTSAKHRVMGDVFVDDRPENVALWQREHEASCGVLWEAPYNRTHEFTQPERSRIVRTNDWATVLRLAGG
jgi:5'(3')-deoxyribonucleotidase